MLYFLFKLHYILYGSVHVRFINTYALCGIYTYWETWPCWGYTYSIKSCKN